jgi:hypothetical protein
MSNYLVARGHVPISFEPTAEITDRSQFNEGWLRIAEVTIEPFRVPTHTYQPFLTVPLEITSQPQYDLSPELIHRSRNNSQCPLRFSGHIALNQTICNIDGYFYQSGSIHGLLNVSPSDDHPVFFERLLTREQQLRSEQEAARLASRARRHESAVAPKMVDRFWGLFPKIGSLFS